MLKIYVPFFSPCRAEELIYRNSLQPPHLKSTYAAQYDLGSQDEDLKVSVSSSPTSSARYAGSSGQQQQQQQQHP